MRTQVQAGVVVAVLRGIDAIGNDAHGNARRQSSEGVRVRGRDGDGMRDSLADCPLELGEPPPLDERIDGPGQPPQIASFRLENRALQVELRVEGVVNDRRVRAQAPDDRQVHRHLQALNLDEIERLRLKKVFEPGGKFRRMEPALHVGLLGEQQIAKTARGGPGGGWNCLDRSAELAQRRLTGGQPGGVGEGHQVNLVTRRVNAAHQAIGAQGSASVGRFGQLSGQKQNSHGHHSRQRR